MNIDDILVRELERELQCQLLPVLVDENKEKAHSHL